MLGILLRYSYKKNECPIIYLNSNGIVTASIAKQSDIVRFLRYARNDVVLMCFMGKYTDTHKNKFEKNEHKNNFIVKKNKIFVVKILALLNKYRV